MALEERILTTSYVSDGVVGQFRILVASTTRERGCAVATAAAKSIGISRNKVDGAGQAVTVVHGGIAKVVAGAPVTIGAEVTSDANGAAVPGSTNPIGTALTAAAAAGVILEVRLR